MRRIISWLLAGLPFDARSRRAIDETLLDWEGEATEALRQAQGRRDWVERTVTEVRGVASIARVTSMSVLRESIDFSWLRGLGRRFAVAALVVFVLTLLLGFQVAEVLGLRAFGIGLLLLPAAVLSAMPPVLLIVIGWRPAVSRSTLGAAVATAVVAFGLMQWVLPLFNEEFRVLIGRELAGLANEAGPQFSPSRPPGRQLPLPALYSAGFACLTATAVVLAGAIARGRALQSWWWIPAVYAGYAAAFSASRLTIQQALKMFGVAESVFFTQALATYALAALLVLLTLMVPRPHVAPDPGTGT